MFRALAPDRNFAWIGRISRSQYNGWVQCVESSAGESEEKKVKCILWLLSTAQDLDNYFLNRNYFNEKDIYCYCFEFKIIVDVMSC
jgi:hypothetical protein